MKGKRTSTFSRKARFPSVREGSITVLYYHSIDESGSVISTSPSQFLWQMRFLRRGQFQILSLSQLVDLLKTQKPFPLKTAVITFDDGYQNNYRYAFPILQEYGFPATMFIATKYCGRTNDWPQPGISIPSLTMLSWSEIREMSRFNIEMGSHSHSHKDLVESGLEGARQEILLSKKKMEDELGRPMRFFAYPYGGADESIKEIIASEFMAACSAQPGRVSHRSDLRFLERVDAGYAIHPLVYRILVSPCCNIYLSMRPWMRKAMGRSRWKK